MKIEFVEALLKAGARHGKRDRELLQKAHDYVAEMANCAHCAGMDKANKPDLGKRGARHAKIDMDRIEKAHGSLVECGAMCPSPNKETGKALDGDLKKYNTSHDNAGRFSDGGDSGSAKEAEGNAREASRAQFDHTNAANEHNSASQRHRVAADDAAKRGDAQAQAYHRSQADMHDRMTDAHNTMATAAKQLYGYYSASSLGYKGGTDYEGGTPADRGRRAAKDR